MGVLISLMFFTALFFILRYLILSAENLPSGSEAGQYCQSCTGLTTLEGLKAACTEEGYFHSSLETLRKRSGSCKLCKYILESHGKWEQRDKFVRLSVQRSSMDLLHSSDRNDSIVCDDHPLKDAVLDEFYVGPCEDLEGKKIRGWSLLKLQATSPEGDPAAGIIPRRPILTDVGGETAKRLLRDRLSYCRRSHRQAPDGDIFPLPTRLLDLGIDPNTRTRLRFTRGESGIYCALSYCWGGERQPTTTKANLIARMAGLETSGLPATIRDAIVVARSLGFRYLWVDALCIVQDHPADKKAEIKAMGSIYYGAALTISASSSSAVSKGFLHPRSEPISIRLPFSLSEGLTGTIGLVANPMGHIEAEPLQQRGWALQEHVLARRLVIFCTHEVLFRCCRSLEPIQKSNIDYTGLEHLLPFTYSSHTSERMRQYIRRNYWQDIVRKYSLRKFSEPEDRVNALVGVATELSKSWDDVYLMGLWRDYFIHHLAWHVWKSADYRTRSNNLPTWTWLSVNAGTTITSMIQPPDAQLAQDGWWRRRNAPLYTLDDLAADSGNRAVTLRIRTMSASSYFRAAREGIFTHTKIILDYSDSETIPSDASLALLGWYKDTMWFGILLIRSLEADGTEMERIGYVESSRSTAHRNIWDVIPRITLTLV